MKRILIIGAAVALVNIVDVDGVGVLGAQDRVAEVVAAARQALGGDTLDTVTALSAEGPFRRSAGQRDIEGTLSLLIVRPDKVRRAEEMSMPGMSGGPSVERISTYNGTSAWDDVQNRGMRGGGMQIVMRGPGDGPGGPGGAITPEQMEEARVRRMKAELQRWTMAFFAESPQAFADGGVAESPEGQADVLETTDEAGRPLRLFVDQQTHLPLMLQYREIRPRMMLGGPGGPGGPGGGRRGGGPGGAAGERPTEEQMKQRIEEMRKQGPPEASAMAMYFADYRKVNGVMLPHRINLSVDGQPNEEWTIDRYRINPNVKASDFEKP